MNFKYICETKNINIIEYLNHIIEINTLSN